MDTPLTNVLDDALPAYVLAHLNGFPARIPSFPGDELYEEDERVIPGGQSSSHLLRKQQTKLRQDINSLVQETTRTNYRRAAAESLLSGMMPIQQMLDAAITGVSGQLSTGDYRLIDFFAPGTALLNTSNAALEPRWGQISLPYAHSPQSQIQRIAGYGPRPGSSLRFARIDRTGLDAARSNTFLWDETDPEWMYAMDGRMDTAWRVPIDPDSEDLIVSIVLPPTMGVANKTNAIGLIPWPLYGTDIIDVYIRNGGSVLSTIPGWTQLSLQGAPRYNSLNEHIENAGASRLFFPASPVREILVRLRPRDVTHIGLILADCWSIEFQTAGTVIVDTQEVGVANPRSISLAGLDASLLSRLPVSLSGTQITIDLSTASAWESPVLTSLAIRPQTEDTDSGFDVSIFA